MRTLVFATNNTHKLNEIRQILGAAIQILSLDDIGFVDDIPETSETIEGNAIQKAAFIQERFKINCFADDTGLEVFALGGAPGVYSARYAGPGCTYADNVNKLLHEMKGASNRSARFVTVIACYLDGSLHLFNGEVEGVIEREPRGTGGFGYDPVFRPLESELTFAEMPHDLKNTLSHRGKAVKTG